MIFYIFHENKLILNTRSSNFIFNPNNQISDVKKINISKKKKYLYFLNHFKNKNIKYSLKNPWKQINFFNNIPFYISPPRVIFWFRTDLDWEENFVLKIALTLPVSPVFIYFRDKNKEKRWSTKRKNFFENSISRLENIFRLHNIQFFILETNIVSSISGIIKKYKSPHIIYSLNTFVPLNKKKEKRIIKKLEITGAKPIIFIFNPLTMESVYCSDKRTYNNFFSFLSEKNVYYKDAFKLKNKNFMISLDKLDINKVQKNYGNINNRKENMIVEKPVPSNNYLFGIEASFDVLKKIFSEFSFGLRFSYKTTNFDNIFLRNYREKIKLNSYLKFFFFIKKLIRRKDEVFCHVTNFE